MDSSKSARSTLLTTKPTTIFHFQFPFCRVLLESGVEAKIRVRGLWYHNALFECALNNFLLTLRHQLQGAYL